MPLTIAQAAHRSDCPASTIRYYERIELLPPPARGANGYRYYNDVTIERLAFINRARSLDFSIAAVSDLLKLADHPHAPCDEIDRLLADQLASVQRTIDQLLRLKDELSEFQTTCEGGHAMCD
ncbi:MAG: MerR family transcriptional regulator [Acidihalobacter sp.]|uniref:MerR family transcriptional regulator n=1 Tax=Acidihalobacter sp. TaxID=1872108 RepID=UPI00307EE600